MDSKPLKQFSPQAIRSLRRDLYQYRMALEILGTYSEHIATAKTLEDALRYALDIICQATGWEIGHAYPVPDNRSRDASTFKIWHLETDQQQAIEQTRAENILYFQTDTKLAGKAFTTKYPVCISDIQTEEESSLKTWCTNTNIHGGFAFPVLDNNEVIAILEFFSSKKIKSNDAMLEIMHCIGCLIGNVLRRKKIEKNLDEKRQALNSSSLVVYSDPSGRMTSVNQAFCHSSGYTEAELVGQHLQLLDANYHPPAFFDELWGTLRQGQIWKGEIKTRKKDDTYFWLSTTIIPLFNEKNEIYQYIFIGYDISDRIAAEEKMHHLAYYDKLTHLPNRSLFTDFLKLKIIECRQQDKPLAILLLNIDNLKLINDSFGHSGGDELIREVGIRLTELLHEFAIVSKLEYDESMELLHGLTDHELIYPVARLGNDEFAMIIQGYKQVSEVEYIAQALMDMFHQHYLISNHDVSITCSIGIALYPHDGKNKHILLKNAYAAMHHAKQDGRHNFQFYDRKMNAASTKKLLLEHRLRSAIDNNEFELYFQPKLDTETGTIISNEALIRWRNPDYGFVSPGEFIPLAEESHLIVDIGDWVLRQACQQNQYWREHGFPDLHIAINVAARQFKRSLIDRVQDALESSHLSPDALELELTEGMIMSGDHETIEKLNQLKALGLHLAIDDFGTGYSSLSYLSQFPLDTLKIDRAFVLNLEHSPRCRAITKGIISLAKGLDLKIIAEGIETFSQLDFLMEQGCHEIQGYLISKPLNAQECTHLMQKLKEHPFQSATAT